MRLLINSEISAEIELHGMSILLFIVVVRSTGLSGEPTFICCMAGRPTGGVEHLITHDHPHAADELGLEHDGRFSFAAVNFSGPTAVPPGLRRRIKLPLCTAASADPSVRSSGPELLGDQQQPDRRCRSAVAGNLRQADRSPRTSQTRIEHLGRIRPAYVVGNWRSRAVAGDQRRPELDHVDGILNRPVGLGTGLRRADVESSPTRPQSSVFSGSATRRGRWH